MKIKFLPISLCLGLSAISNVVAEDRIDLLNFENNDTLHGQFKGLTSTGRVIWKNAEAEKNIAFNTENLRRLIINQGHLTKPFTHTGYVTLVNKDIIPGNITSIGEDSITLKTDYAGEVTIKRSHITSIEFAPLGDKVLYYGPFSADDWTHYDFAAKKAVPKKKEDAKEEADKDKKDEKDKDKDKEEEKKKPLTWEFKNFGWKSTNKAGGIINKKELPSRFRLTFAIETAQYAYPSLVLMADLKQPEKKKPEEGDKAAAAAILRQSGGYSAHFGTHLAFRLSSGQATLTFHGYDKEGNALADNIAGTNFRSSYTSSQGGTKKYDVRVDKENNLIMLYSGKNLAGQWDITDYTERLKGTKYGYSMPYVRQNSPVIVKDIVLTNWNGVKDPAITLENAEKDIVMLANGTDRFAGKTLSYKDGNLGFKNDYTELAIPTKQIQSLYLATKLSKKMEGRKEGEVTIRFYGNGKITGFISKGDNGSIKLKTQSIGDIVIKPEYITTLDFLDLSDSFEL